MSLGLFDAFGVELEYMVVGRHDLNVRPVVADLLAELAGAPAADLIGDPISWSNELAAHVVEFKTTRPAARLAGLAEHFQAEVRRANAALAASGARLLSGGCHPWMDPRRESNLWPGEGREVYEHFHRLFDCRSHGWLNLQSVHLNLPFQGDEQFDRLHSAIRILLPLLPGLAASSPFLEGAPTGMLDTRLQHYRTHCARVSCMAGSIIPEPIASRGDYERLIYGPIAEAIRQVDPGGTLRPAWTNARGAIARFDRGSIEIRLLDVQDCPRMDLAIVALVVGALRVLVDRNAAAEQRRVEDRVLIDLFGSAIRAGERARIEDAAHLTALGLNRPLTIGEAWAALRGEVESAAPDLLAPHREELDFLASHGPLARRLLAAAGPDPSRDRLREVYARLADALHQGHPFR